jgi:hypothetical protein
MLWLAGNILSAPDARFTAIIAGLVIWWIASFVLSFGTPRSSRLRIPSGLLVLACPLPAVVLSRFSCDAVDHGFATAAIGIMPTFATAGWFSPLAPSGIRVLQGLALGGE